VTVGGITAEVLFSGLAPGLVGVNQVNVRIPMDVPSGDVAIVIRVDHARSKQKKKKMGTAPTQTASAIGFHL
jgi:uncharacterized protein (TIGR03437 family)